MFSRSEEICYQVFVKHDVASLMSRADCGILIYNYIKTKYVKEKAAQLNMQTGSSPLLTPALWAADSYVLTLFGFSPS